ncbi:MAG: aminopeptidase [Candidatus Cloacimonadaceae bacterium]|jgi:aspartyl aminopeptidase|nr:aminopeptidase [Candidatus Cloacimonadota bacterium]MDY0126683.1 aminopeptidase [Candidatus Cloacimonadaceae bacterium]MCB5255577.1 aminopeptidase [Candidatus Cloacimonadota bacterium]MCK9177405.1 aminopeptidase [Candidatus Cloacimonadota bacterium]MCK9241683.1 aminopeptidase [Candidatus Cloacimonadota bacterium]
MKKTKAPKKSEFAYERKNFWKDAPVAEQKDAMEYAIAYKEFLNQAKTEREVTAWTEKLLKKHKFVDIHKKAGAKKVYSIFREKTMAIAILGSEPLSEGFNMVAAHIDSPRIDLKQNPLYEDGNTKMACMRTHYYGGIKKYQWVSTPLALHGVIVKQDGSVLNISIGEKDDEPVFIIPDLLPHLAAKEQYSKNLSDAIDASKLNLVFSGMVEPSGEEKEAAKAFALKALNTVYGITEADFLSAELQLVPAIKSRDAGLDSSMVVGYGQDDRVCAYTGITALLANQDQKPKRSMIVYLSDKEEVGSQGATGAHSVFIQDFVSDLMAYNNEDNNSANLRKAFINSYILSADVTAAMDPNYPNVHEKENAVILNFGIGVSKFTGSRGKYGCNDADAEFAAKVLKLFTEAGVFWQTGELGKVDEGGGGTIAYILANLGARVIDCGVGIMGMHSLYELSSKADIYSTYKGYKAFLVNK